MKVSPDEPFAIIYSVFQHEYLGYLLESFAVRLGDRGQLTLQHQNLSTKNAPEFQAELDEDDYELIRLMESMLPENIVKKFSRKPMKAVPFFLKVFSEKPDEALQKEIEAYLERRRSNIMARIKGKRLFEMGNDGEPTWKEIEIMQDPASILFHFRRNEDNTHYFPTIKCGDEKVHFQYNDSYLVCKDPAWLVAENKLYHFNGHVEGNKISPFLQKKFIAVPRSLEENYYEKFVTQLIASYHVYAKGFEIKTEKHDPIPVLYFSPFEAGNASLFDDNKEESQAQILFELQFRYGQYLFKGSSEGNITVKMEKDNESYTFYRMQRNRAFETRIFHLLRELDLALPHAKRTIEQSSAFSWMKRHRETLESHNFEILQKTTTGKKYFVGESSIDIKIDENIDWFDIHAIVRFGQFKISFQDLRKKVMQGKTEIPLPNGETAVIPKEWFEEYEELFSFMDEQPKGHTLQKHHIALVKDLEEGNLAKVTIDRKLNQLRNFEEIDPVAEPEGFQGDLRPYQKAGYDWLQFLRNFRFGGCLADDMGLGKTVQTLALLQAEKERGASTSLLIMPTSLIYNWEMEARKFTPGLKTFAYTGTFRDKDVTQFTNYDLILTTYGVTRLDIDLLKDFKFHYVILDESQAIKNPSSNIAQAVRKLRSGHRLILTGTPLENSTLDLWSQMSFVNPGLLGDQNFFTREFLKPIENDRNEVKTRKLHTIIKPFILRRNKGQVLKDLPEKVENVHYSTMSVAQEERYQETKAYYRNRILKKIDEEGVGASQMVLIQGLTRLRQLANHPKLVDSEYEGDSGKMEDITDMLANAISEGHKILVFSQFVKHLELVRSWLLTRDIPFAYLDGKTRNRKEQVELFQKDEDLRLFLISLKAGGLGLNLTEADYVFILDPWWNPAAEAQAIDRAHRIGQQQKVFTYKFITKNTVEEKILALQQRKLQLVGDLIQEEEGVLKNLSKQDIADLLS